MKTVVLMACLIVVSVSQARAQQFGNDEAQFARWVTSIHPPVRSQAVNRTVQTEFVRMNDGVRLHTSIYIPEGSGPFPVILVRTPYNRVTAGQDSFAYRGIADYYNPKGYAVVIQSIRGKHESEGVYRLLSRGEIADGNETLNWISEQSWSNESVAVMGVSHDGFTSLAAGVENHPSLKLIFAGGAPADFRTDAFFGNGVMYTGLLDYIAFISTESGIPYDSAFYEKYLNRLLNEPRIKLHDNKVQEVQLPLWDQLIPQLNNPLSAYWKNRRIRDRIPEIRIPTVHIAGLFQDGDMPDTVRNYLAMIANPAISKSQRLILGWWDHGGSGPYGDNSNITPYLLSRYDAYLDFYLKGIDSPLVREKPVQVFSKGEEKWIYSDRWPIQKKTKSLTLHLEASGKLTVPKPAASSLSYVANPTEVPSSATQLQLITESDQLVFLSEPMKGDLAILGDAAVKLYASTDAVDADWIILVFRRPENGPDELLAPVLGMMQGRYRNGATLRPKLLERNQLYEYDIPISPVSAGVKKGERIGVLVSSNLNPSVVRNANSGKPVGKDVRFVTARQKIYIGGEFPSALLLKVKQ